MMNPKFPKKEDVLWYLITVGGFIIVGSSHYFFPSPSLNTTYTSYICPHSAVLPTIAVPGNEEEYPRISADPPFALGSVWGAGMVGCHMDDSGYSSPFARVVFLRPTFKTPTRRRSVRPQKADNKTQLLNRVFLGGGFFLEGLIIALCYTAVQDQRGLKTNFYFFTVPAQLIPYCMLLASLLMNPASIPLQITGIFAAHMHDFLTRLWPEFGGGWNILSTPAFITKLVQTPRIFKRDYGTAIRPPNVQTTGSSTGASTGPVLPDSWRTRGSGQRLGGN